MKQWHYGYLAAMVDAESHVGIQREMSARRRTPAYIVRYELAMTDKTTVDFVNSLLPMAKRISVGSKGRRLPYYRLRLTQQDAIRFLKSLLPYVQGKRRQIELCLKMDQLRRKYSPSRRHMGQPHFQPLPPAFAIQADQIFAEFRSHQLNKKPRST